jgi:uncharacterized protein (TIGR02452 family)
MQTFDEFFSELEKHLLPWETINIPEFPFKQQALSSASNGTLTNVGYHPNHGYFVTWSAGLVSGIIAIEVNPYSYSSKTKDKSFFINLSKETMKISEDDCFEWDNNDYFLQESVYRKSRGQKGKYIVCENDVLDAALLTGSNLVLIFSSNRRPGGGWEEGKTTQEESIYYRTNLCHVGLDKEDPFYDCKGENPEIAVNAIVFRDSNYNLCNPWRCDFVYMAAPVVKNPEEQKMAAKKTKEQIEKLASLVLEHGEKSIVIGPWGCGIYGNDPTTIAKQFKETFDPLLSSGALDYVVVSVLNDENGLIFKKVFQ